jgi:hypothetical protein
MANLALEISKIVSWLIGVGGAGGSAGVESWIEVVIVEVGS